MSITPRIQGSLVGRKLEEPSSYHRGMRDPMVYSILTLLKNSPSHTHIHTHTYISQCFMLLGLFHPSQGDQKMVSHLGVQIWGKCCW